MKGYYAATAVFPDALRRLLLSLPLNEQAVVQEIRLYRSHPIRLTVRGQPKFLSADGTLCAEKRHAVMGCDEWLQQTVDKACGYSVYAHQEELRHGYLTTADGCRIGVAGTAVTDGETIRSFRDITSLCVRVAREHEGCADMLAPLVCNEMGVRSMLICSEPCGGKSSVLKDLLVQAERRGVIAVVVDERGELAPTAARIGCDLLLHIPKAQGIEQALRTLSPQLIVFDELGDEREIQAVTTCLCRGVPTVASVHCRTPAELLNRASLRSALYNGAFEYLCFLYGRERPGEIRCVIKTEDWLREMVGDRVGMFDRCWLGDDGMVSAETSGSNAVSFLAVDRPAVGSHSVFGATARRFVGGMVAEK